MKLRTLLAGTALTTGLLAAGAMPALADVIIPLAGGFTGPVQLNFNNYESFLTPQGAVTSTPAVGDQNFGIFTVFSISKTTSLKLPLWTANQNGQVLVGVFNDINVKTLTGTGANVKTTNTGGVFKLYMVPTAAYLAAGGDQGIAGYANAGCSIGSLCYNGITNAAGGQLVLTMDLVPGISLTSPTATLTASVDTTGNPPTGQAAFLGMVIGDAQFLPDVSGKDSFCPNSATSGPNLCAGADGSTFALASQDPIVGTVVPEPASLALLGSGLLGLGVFRRRRRKSK